MKRLFITIALSACAYGQLPAAFTLVEPTGTAWPDQPIEFRYDGGQPTAGTTKMMLSVNGGGATEVPWQWVSSCSDATATLGCIVVRSTLGASATNVWTLSAATPSASQTHPVVLATVGNNYEITNGLTGVRVVTAAANGTPWNKAPIQGIQLASGTWTGASGSPNLIYTEDSGDAGQIGVGSLQTPAYTATGYTATVVDSGPLKTTIQVSYTFNRPQYTYGGVNAPWLPAGAGHYTAIITLFANSKSIVVDEDSDMMFSYYLPVYNELTPDIARIKTHYATDPTCGYQNPAVITGATNATPIVITSAAGVEFQGWKVTITGVIGNTAANGTYYAKLTGYSAGQFALYSDAGLTVPVAGNGTYSGGGLAKPTYQGQFYNNPVEDGLLDITYTSDRTPDGGVCVGPDAHYGTLVVSFPAGPGSQPWYTEMYNSTAGSSGPVVGIYSGRSSLQIKSATGPAQPGWYSSNSHFITGAQAAGIEVQQRLRGSDNSRAALVHRNWNIFVSTQADLLATNLHQPIADEQNGLSGINLSRIYTYKTVYSDPGGGWQWLYLPTAGANTLVSWVRDGTSKCGSSSCYYDLLHSSGGATTSGIGMLDMWRGNSSSSVQTALNTSISLASSFGGYLVNGDNRMDSAVYYYQIGYYTSPAIAVLNALLMDSNSTSGQKTVAKALLAFFGSVLWDNDWTPVDNDSGATGGLTNQIQQYLQFRTQAAGATEGANPFLASKETQAAAYATGDFATYFSSTGAAGGSTHYQGAFFQPLILNYLNLARIGTLSMNDPKWFAYANWELSIQTPPEPRFGNILKGYSNGDGNTEADVRTGMLANALQTVNPTLAGNLMWAWEQSNSATTLTHDQQFITTIPTIDPTVPSITPTLSSINVPGYHTAARFGFGTAHETASWFINGGFYSAGGHRHADDGQVSIYAHAAPLAIDWNANLYSPETQGRFFHNSIVLDSELTQSWSADNALTTDADFLLDNPTNTEFVNLPESAHSVATFAWPDTTVWTRTVRTMAPNPEYPIIYVTDSYSGPSASASKTMTWNTMATGAVTTPAGSITPTTRFSTGCQQPAGALPSNGTVNALSNGLQAFHFTGVTWAAHATGGIDWDLYENPSSGNAHVMIGNWGHGCQSAREAGEYAAANGGSFAETQHILRVNDTGAFNTVILPYRKTETPTRTITSQTCGTQIVQGSETTCFDGTHYTYTDGTATILSAFDSGSHSAFGYTLSGGTQSIKDDGVGHKYWTISGAATGTRTLVMPSGTVTYFYAGGLQADPITLNPDSGMVSVSIGGKIVIGGKTIIDH